MRRAPKKARLEESSSENKTTATTDAPNSETEASSSATVAVSLPSFLPSSRVVLVTGGGSGIGRATLLVMAEQWGRNCQLVAVGRRQEMLDETAKLVYAHGSSPCLTISADLTSEAQVRDVFDQVKTKFGRLDVLFNNAGKSLPGTSIEDLELKDFEEVMKTNVTASFLCTKYAIKIMKEQQPQGGRIINNGSIAAYAPRPEALAYTCSKHAISGLTKSTSLDGRKYNIACGQIDIGNTASDMTAQMNKGMLQADGSTKPEPVCDVLDVAKAVLYMASLPLSTNVFNMTVMATTMPYIGRG